MLNAQFRGINIFNPIKGRENEIIEYFVAYYGERYRQQITNAINNTTFIFTTKNDYWMDNKDALFLKISELKDDLQKELIKELPYIVDKKYEKSIDIEIIDIVLAELGSGNELSEVSMPFVQDMVAMFSLCKPSLGNIFDSKFATIWVKENKQDVINLLTNINNLWNSKYKLEADKIASEGASAFLKIHKYDKPINKVKKAFKRKQKKLISIYLSKINPKFDSLKKIEKENLIATYFSLLDKGKGAFLSEETFSFVMSRHIALFNFMGITETNVDYDIKELYEQYRKNNNLIKLLFNSSITEPFDELSLKSMDEIIKYNAYFLDALKTIRGLDIKGGDYNVAESLMRYIYFNSKTAAYVINYLDSNNNLRNLCVCQNALLTSDDTLLHEISHVIENVLVKICPNGFMFKTGLELMEETFPNANFYLNKKSSPSLSKVQERESEMLSEVINDYFALELAERVKKDGVHFCLAKPYPSTYSDAFPLFKKFIEAYKPAIMEARLSSNPRAFIDFVGVQNYYLMCDMADTYVSRICGEKYIVPVEEEIRTKTGIDGEVFYKAEEFIYRTDIEWSKEALNVFKFYKTMDLIIEKLHRSKQDVSIQDKK